MVTRSVGWDDKDPLAGTDFHSCWAIGCVEPDPAQDVTMELDGQTVTVRQGKVIRCGESTSFHQSGYLMCNESQVLIRFVCRVSDHGSPSWPNSVNSYPGRQHREQLDPGPILKFLVEHPETAQIHHMGGLPLLTAISNQAPHSVIARLLECHPDAARAHVGNLSGPDAGTCTDNCALHLALKHKASTETVVALVAAHPEAARARPKDGSNTGKRALHVGLETDASDQTITALLAAFPEAAQSELCSGLYPFDVAVRDKRTAALIDALGTACPGLQLVRMLAAGASAEAVSALLVASPNAAQFQLQDGSTRHSVLNVALKHQASTDTVSRLMRAHPDACWAQLTSEDGSDHESKLSIQPWRTMHRPTPSRCCWQPIQ